MLSEKNRLKEIEAERQKRKRDVEQITGSGEW